MITIKGCLSILFVLAVIALLFFAGCASITRSLADWRHAGAMVAVAEQETEQAILNDLRAEILERLTAMHEQATTPEPEPEPEPQPQVEPAATYSLPTNRMRQQLARFDDLNDADQVAYLKAMGW